MAAQVIDGFINDEMQRLGLPASKIALIGFSQGTMMSLHVALRRPAQVAGILGFSGLLAGPELLADQAVSKPPVLLIHGDMDDMLPVQNLHDAVSALTAVDINVEWHVSQGAGHTIAQDGLELGMDFLGRLFPQN